MEFHQQCCGDNGYEWTFFGTCDKLSDRVEKADCFFFLVNIKIEILELALQTDRACVCVFPNVWTGFTDPTKAVGLALATTVRLVPRSISILH